MGLGAFRSSEDGWKSLAKPTLAKATSLIWFSVGDPFFGVPIGRDAVVGAWGRVVFSKNVAAGKTVVGNPAQER